MKDDQCPACGGQVRPSNLPFVAPLTLFNCWIRCPNCAQKGSQMIAKLFPAVDPYKPDPDHNKNPVKPVTIPGTETTLCGCDDCNNTRQDWTDRQN